MHAEQDNYMAEPPRNGNVARNVALEALIYIIVVRLCPGLPKTLSLMPAQKPPKTIE